MTVEELISINQMITDVVITVRKDGTALLDELNIGCERGEEPRYPTMIPKEERYIGNMCLETKKKAKYIPKSINAWDDGHDYWQVKPNRIPKAWLDLEVYAWEVWPASTVTHRSPRRSIDGHSNINFRGQRLNITALPSGESLAVKEPKLKQQDDTEQLDGQMSFDDWEYEVVTI